MMQVRLYSRAGCHLCDEARDELEALQPELPHKLQVIDIDNDPELQAKYGTEIPVIEVGPYRLKAPFTRADLLRVLGAARDRLRHIEQIDSGEKYSGALKQTWSQADSITYWFSRHYVAVLNLLVFVYVGLPVLAPILMNAGVDGPARTYWLRLGTDHARRDLTTRRDDRAGLVGGGADGDPRDSRRRTDPLRNPASARASATGTDTQWGAPS